MKVKGNNTIYNIVERRIIRDFLSKEYGKQISVSDCRPKLLKYGDEEIPISKAIKDKTGLEINGTTVERIVGLRPKFVAKGIKNENLNKIASYINIKDHEALAKHIRLHLSKTNEDFLIDNFFKSHLIKLQFESKKELQIRCVSDNKYEVVDSKNTKFLTGDILSIKKLDAGFEFLCENVSRTINQKFISLGAYTSGPNNLIDHIVLSK